MICVCAVRKQCQHATLVEFCQFSDVAGPTIYRRVIQFIIPAMHNQPQRRPDSQPNGIRDAVTHVIRFHLERPQMHHISRFHRLELDTLFQIAPQLHFDQATCQFRRVDRRSELLQEMRQRADVILMPVRDHDATDTIFLALQIAIVGDNVIHAWHIAFREHHPDVNDQDVTPVFQGHHILTNFPQTAQGNDLQLFHQFTTFYKILKRKDRYMHCSAKQLYSVLCSSYGNIIEKLVNRNEVAIQEGTFTV